MLSSAAVVVRFGVTVTEKRTARDELRDLPRARDTGAVLLTWIAEIADESLVLDPANRPVEWETNTWWLGSEAEDRATLAAVQVIAAFERTAEALRCRIGELGFSGAATFYVWHDTQAGQLRCSTGSVLPDSLPFGGAYEVSADLGAIVQGFLDDDDPGVTRISEAGDIELQAPDFEQPPAFPVWTRNVGQSGDRADS